MIFFFEFLRILEKNRKKKKLGNLGKHGLLRYSVGNPRRSVALCRSVGCHHHSEVGVPKWHPLRYAMVYPCNVATECYVAA